MIYVELWPFNDPEYTPPPPPQMNLTSLKSVSCFSSSAILNDQLIINGIVFFCFFLNRDLCARVRECLSRSWQIHAVILFTPTHKINENMCIHMHKFTRKHTNECTQMYANLCKYLKIVVIAQFTIHSHTHTPIHIHMSAIYTDFSL